MTRRELREHCFKMLFCADFYPAGETKEQIEHYFDAPEEDEMTPEGVMQVLHNVDLGEKDSDYLKQKTEAIVEKLPELDDRINAVAQGWKTRRMGKVELYDEEVPEKVAINEAVELAKKFGQGESPAFINGVLARLVP